MRMQSHYTGRNVIDGHGLALGVVTDVVYDEHTQRPEYFVVSPGAWRRSRYLPLDGSVETPDGTIVAAWDREWFHLAPTATGGRLRPDTRREIDAHYAPRRRAC